MRVNSRRSGRQWLITHMGIPIRATALAPRSADDFGSTSNIQQPEHLRGLSESGFSNDVPRNAPTLLEFV